MTEEELKNKCKERAKIFQQAMENCKSSSPMDCIEWFADRIAELEAKLKHAEENCINKTCVVFKDKEDCVAKLLEFEKENAELRYQLNKNPCVKTPEWYCSDCLKENKELRLKLDALEGQTPWKDIKDKSEVIGKLTKAKELLAKWVELYKPKSETALPTPIQVDTEQFLKGEADESQN